MNKTFRHIILILCIAILCAGCQKEITVTLPDTQQEYVVEASVNQYFQSLNYVFISKSVDYFNPDLSMRGISGAKVSITEGTINGTDTLYNGTTYTMTDIASIPGSDSLFKNFTGIYFSTTLVGQSGKAYLLNITLADGTKITGKTYIPKVVPIDSITYIVKDEDINHDKKNDAYVTLYYFDPPEQNNYRLATHHSTDSLLIGWGAADSYRTFDDQMLNNAPRFITYNRPFGQGDTLNFYLNSIGRKEFLFWESFASASNNNGPFATPVTVQSNISGAIGSFTGYGCSFRQLILK
jgi:hypothetical protein